MLPTLRIGDLVLVDRNAYGYRLPLLNLQLTPGEPPARGEIAVFVKPRPEPEREVFYIKRIVGLPARPRSLWRGQGRFHQWRGFVARGG